MAIEIAGSSSHVEEVLGSGSVGAFVHPTEAGSPRGAVAEVEARRRAGEAEAHDVAGGQGTWGPAASEAEAAGLGALSNTELWTRTLTMNHRRRRAVAMLVAHLAEVERRSLHLREGYSSMYDLCVRGLGMSEGEAHRSISGARVSRRFPLVIAMLADGGLHLTGLSLLASRLTEANHGQILEACCRKTKAEIQEVLARWFPRPDVPDCIGLVDFESRDAQGDLVRDGIEPRSADRFAFRFSASAAFKAKLEHARNRMSHVGRDLETVFERALDLLIAERENTCWGKTDRPHRSPGAKHGAPTRESRREVYERDAGQCTYVSAAGVRCSGKAFLNFDHVEERARGGGGGPGNGRLLCAAHNQCTRGRLSAMHSWTTRSRCEDLGPAGAQS
ncbi:MAG: hypothetical protein R3B13_16140 [Polyangiaceae bacterium]